MSLGTTANVIGTYDESRDVPLQIDPNAVIYYGDRTTIKPSDGSDTDRTKCTASGTALFEAFENEINSFEVDIFNSFNVRLYNVSSFAVSITSRDVSERRTQTPVSVHT